MSVSALIARVIKRSVIMTKRPFWSQEVNTSDIVNFLLVTGKLSIYDRGRLFIHIKHEGLMHVCPDCVRGLNCVNLQLDNS